MSDERDKPFDVALPQEGTLLRFDELNHYLTVRYQGERGIQMGWMMRVQKAEEDGKLQARLVDGLKMPRNRVIAPWSAIDKYYRSEEVATWLRGEGLIVTHQMDRLVPLDSIAALLAEIRWPDDTPEETSLAALKRIYAEPACFTLLFMARQLAETRYQQQLDVLIRRSMVRLYDPLLFTPTKVPDHALVSEREVTDLLYAGAHLTVDDTSKSNAHRDAASHRDTAENDPPASDDSNTEAAEAALDKVHPSADANTSTADELDRPTERPLLQQRYQEQEILRVIRELGHDPIVLPKRMSGKASVKSAVRQELQKFTHKVFDLAWDRLRASGYIKDK
jgi:hypothetical protein